MHRLSANGDPVLRAAVIVIAVILTFATLKAGQNVFAPMVLALVTGVMLAPITEQLERFGLSAGIASALVLMFGLSAIAVLLVLAQPVVVRIADELPRIQFELRSIIDSFSDLVTSLKQMNREVEAALSGDAAQVTESTESTLPDITTALLLAPVVAAQVLIFCGTLFFFLLTRKSMYASLPRWFGSSRAAEDITRRLTNAEQLVARYFLTITCINTGLGVALGGSLFLIGLPGPLVWAVVAALLNFVLYVGPMAMTAGLLIAGIVAFDGPMVLAPPAIFLILNMMEAQFVTPTFVGRQVSVNPLLIFVSLVIWLWMWGPIGGIIAIPMLVITLALLDVFAKEDEAEAVEPATV